MIIAIASGTGKTTVAINLALSVPDAQYLDCDVEEPNGHLFLHPDLQARHPVTAPLPQINWPWLIPRASRGLKPVRSVTG